MTHWSTPNLNGKEGVNGSSPLEGFRINAGEPPLAAPFS
jgi:hypothetical protein